jgi:predicted RecA/RadA family phage recombinase
MALNEIYKDASEVTLAVASTVKSGDLVVVGGLVGVAEKDALAGENGTFYVTLKFTGAFQFTIVTGDTLAVGDIAYADTAPTEVGDTNTNAAVGHVISVQSGKAVVRLVAGL